MSATLPSRPAAAVRRPHRSLRFTRDDELVRLVRVGDERAFEAVYDRHHRGILAFCRHMLGSREEAEDAVQHTFAAAHRSLVASDRPMQLKAWLYAIARNRCLSILRVRREEQSLDDAPEPSTDGLTAEVHRRQELKDMLSDLQRLPDDQRAALVLAELGDLSHEEIAEAIGVRTGKVKALVFQARASLAGSRAAREADCGDIQEQLAVLRGGALRRTTIRRHVEHCAACAAFKAEVQRQRSALAAVLPVAPTLALKETVLGAAAAGGAGAAATGGAAAGGAAAGGAAAGGAAGAGGGLAAKVLAVTAIAGGTAGGGAMVVQEINGGRPGGQAIALEIPEEKRAGEMVVALRGRAEVVGEQRAADRAKAPSGGPDRSRPSTPRGSRRQTPKPATPSSSAPAREARPASSAVTPDGRRGNVAARRDGELDVAGAAPTAAAPDTVGAQPQASEPAGAPSAGAQPARPGKAKAKAKGKNNANGNGNGNANGHDKARGNGHAKHGDAAPGATPAPQQQQQPATPAAPSTGGGSRSEGDRGGAKGKANRPSRDAPPAAPAVPPQPDPTPAAPAPSAPPAAEEDPGKGKGKDDGRGRGPRAIVSALVDALTIDR